MLAAPPERVRTPVPVFVIASVFPVPESVIEPLKELVVSLEPMVRTEVPVALLVILAPAAAVTVVPLMVWLLPFKSRMVRWLASVPVNTTLLAEAPEGITFELPRRSVVDDPVFAEL